jgi:hypothetical protein
MRRQLFTLLALLGLVAVGGAHDHKHYRKTLPVSRETKKGHFGSVEITEVFDADENNEARILKTVHLSGKPYVRDYER